MRAARMELVGWPGCRRWADKTAANSKQRPPSSHVGAVDALAAVKFASFVVKRGDVQQNQACYYASGFFCPL